MNQPIDAIYENGVLRPLQPLSLPEHAQVKVTVLSSAENSQRQDQLANLKELLSVAEDQSASGHSGPFDAEETKQRLRDRLAKEGFAE